MISATLLYIWTMLQRFQNTRILAKLYDFLTLCVHSGVTLVLLGAPYWHYRGYRFHLNKQSYEDSHLEKWLKRMEASWEIYSFLCASTLPVMFPMLSISGLPACSIAAFAATMALSTGVVCLATSAFYKVFVVQGLQIDRVRDQGHLTSSTAWIEVHDKAFWILLSLPTFWFVLYFGLLLATVILSVWERLTSGTVDDIHRLACPPENLFVFKCVTLGLCFASVLHFVFIFLRSRSLSN